MAHELKLIFVRHGQAAPASKPDGPPGPSLSALGKRQAERVGKRLSTETYNYIYASDMRRAAQTADAIVKHHPGTPITRTAKLREVSNFLTIPGREPGGSSVHAENRKRRSELQTFARQLNRKHRNHDQVLIVAHGHVIRFLVATLAGVDPKHAVTFECANTSLAEVIIHDGRFLWLYRTNDDRHLQ